MNQVRGNSHQTPPTELGGSRQDAAVIVPGPSLLGIRLRPRFRPLLFTFFLSIAAAKLAGLWQASAPMYGLMELGRFPLRLAGAVTIISLWLYGYRKIFLALKWPGWLAVPAVVVGLTPLAWILTKSLGVGASFISLFILQSPFAVAYNLWVRREMGG